MTPDALAALHAVCFDTAPRPWNAGEFQDLLQTAGVELFSSPDERSFLLTRFAGAEAEILTLCTHPDGRRAGAARVLLKDFEEKARALGVNTLLLEVAETNLPARSLYAASGYEEAGHRKNYYRIGEKRSVSALVLRKALV